MLKSLRLDRNPDRNPAVLFALSQQ